MGAMSGTTAMVVQRALYLCMAGGSPLGPRDIIPAPRRARLQKPVVLLHVSDLHAGGPGRPYLAQSLAELHQDLRELAHHIGPPDLVLFTGDLAWSGQPEQYIDVVDRLDGIVQAVREVHPTGRRSPPACCRETCRSCSPCAGGIWAWWG